MLGLEGGFDRKLELASLAPLSMLSGLRYLFLAATRPADKSLAPLHQLKGLKHLSCGTYFPDEEFVALNEGVAGASTVAGWKMIEDHGSIRKGLARARNG